MAADGRASCLCKLRDISARGAGLVMEDGAAPPDPLLVLHLDAGTVRWPCRVVWRRGDAVGVLFR